VCSSTVKYSLLFDLREKISSGYPREIFCSRKELTKFEVKYVNICMWREEGTNKYSVVNFLYIP